MTEMTDILDLLTPTQKTLLAFLAGRLDQPPARSNAGTYRALELRELIERDESNRWRATRRGTLAIEASAE